MLFSRSLGAILMAVLLVSACAGFSGPVAADGACGQAVKSGMQAGEMRFGVLERSYQLYVPKNWTNRTPGPVVLGLHGGYGSGATFAEQTGAPAAADAHNMLLVLPDGHLTAWNAGSCCKPAARLKVNDVGFITALLKRVQEDYCVDPEKIYATGFSNGAMLTHRLACERPDLLAGIAPVSGGLMTDACRANSPMPALLIQGRDDPRIFWEGGVFDGSYRPSMQETVSMLAGRNRCEMSETGQQKAGGVLRCQTRQNCDGAPLRYCAVQAVGHQWPGGKTYWADKLGPNTQRFDATAEIFQFFATLSK